MEEMKTLIVNLQKILYDASYNGSWGDDTWLKEACLNYCNLFKILHKFLIFEIDQSKNQVKESCFLCIQQSIVCLKCVERILTTENEKGIILVTARQCFIERLLWCLAKFKSEIQLATDNVVAQTEIDFIVLLDGALDILEEFDIDANGSNIAQKRSENMMESVRLRSIIDQLLSYVLAYINIALDDDKKMLSTLSHNVLKECMEFEHLLSLAQHKTKSHEDTSYKLKENKVSNALYSMENAINESLLRLILEVFNGLDNRPVDELQDIDESNDENSKIEKFDLLIDRFIQIGMFAISFSYNESRSVTMLRSCLASIESLDSYLVPSFAAVTAAVDPSRKILVDHFYEEVGTLKHFIQQIIDSNAFCTIVIEEIDKCVAKNNLGIKTSDDIKSTLDKCHILLKHFQINSENLKLTNDKITKFYYSDFKLMLTECDAIVNYPEPIENFDKRTLKRLKILKTTLNKLQKAIRLRTHKENDVGSIEKDTMIQNIECDFPSKCSDYFKTIRASALGIILYDSKRTKSVKKNLTLVKCNLSTIRGSKRKFKKRHSLRMTIFKKNEDINIDDTLPTFNDDLQITNILEQLNDLSTTFNNIVKFAD